MTLHRLKTSSLPSLLPTPQGHFLLIPWSRSTPDSDGGFATAFLRFLV